MNNLCQPPVAARQMWPAIVRPKVVSRIMVYLSTRPEGADLQELQATFAGTEPEATPIRNMRARLHNMVSRGQLITEGVGEFRRWYAGHGPAAHTQPKLVPAQLTPQATSRMAQPDRYDVMRAPVYVPPPSSHGRLGADDHKGCLSHGHRC